MPKTSLHRKRRSTSFKTARSWLSRTRSKHSKRASDPIKRKPKPKPIGKGNRSLSLKKRSGTRSRSKSERCAICLEPIRDELGRLSCGHRFHVHCICMTWKGASKPSCPLCRRAISIVYARDLCGPIWNRVVNRFVARNRDWFSLGDLKGIPPEKIEHFIITYEALKDEKRKAGMKGYYKKDPRSYVIGLHRGY